MYELIPWRSRPTASPSLTPSMTVPIGMPRAVCVCGSKNSSTWRTDVVRRHSIEVGDSEIAKVLPGPQYVARRVVDVEEVLQVAEVVRGLHRCYVWVGQRDVVATGEREHQLRLQRSLDV